MVVYVNISIYLLVLVLRVSGTERKEGELSRFITSKAPVIKEYPNFNSVCFNETKLTPRVIPEHLILWVEFHNNKLTESVSNREMSGEVLTGPPHMPSNKQGSGLFTGVNRLQIAHFEELNGSEQSIGFWIFPVNKIGRVSRRIFSKTGSKRESREYTPTLILTEGGSLKLLVSSDQNEIESLQTVSILPQRRWSHLEIQMSISMAQIWINGRVDAQKIFTGRISPNTNDLVIGGGELHISPGIWALISDLRVWDTILSPSQILAIGGTKVTANQLVNMGETQGFHPCYDWEVFSYAFHVARVSGWLTKGTRIRPTNTNNQLNLGGLPTAYIDLYCQNI